MPVPRFQISQMIADEIAVQRQRNNQRYEFVDGSLLSRRSDDVYIYSFNTETDINYLDGTNLRIYAQDMNGYATLLSNEKSQVIIETSLYLGEHVDVLEYSIDPIRFLEALKEAIEDMKETSAIVEKIVQGCERYTGFDEMSMGQEEAVRKALSQEITFIWGPPGTGKTETLALIAQELINQKRRTLMLSCSNVSVDGSVSRVFSKMENKKPGIVIRYGYPRDKNVLDHEYLSAFNCALLKNPELKEKREDLLNRQKSAKRGGEEYRRIKEDLKKISEQLVDEEKRIVNDAMFVATTLAKATVDSCIRNGCFDTVIVDEASMALFPQIILAASYASNHFACIGDFCQLPPIAATPALKENIFSYTKLTSVINRGDSNDWLCMLYRQFRMHSRIADFVNRHMYGRRLETADGVDEDRGEIVESSPIKEKPLSFVDLSDICNPAVQDRSGSRFNPVSAILSFGLAIKAAEKFSVGIISPYRLQANLLNLIARDYAEQNPDAKKIVCSTVHQFQGSEDQIIIYDATDCFNLSVGALLKNPEANNLFNVAVTRARGKFIAVANKKYFEIKGLFSTRLSKGQSDSLFYKLSRACERTDNISSQQLLDELPHGDSYRLYDRDASEDFMNDLKNAKSKIRIMLPGKSAGNRREIASLLSRLENVNISIKANDTKDLPEYAQRSDSVSCGITIIDDRIIWINMPDNNLSYDNQVDTQVKPVIRFAGEQTAKFLSRKIK